MEIWNLKRPPLVARQDPQWRNKDTNPLTKLFNTKFVLSKRNAGTKMKQTLKVWLNNWPSKDSSC